MRIFDAHLHIIAPAFSLHASDGFIPDTFSVADYLARSVRLGVAGGVVVSGSFQRFDQTYLLDAFGRLGPDFVGVTQLPASTPDGEIQRLAAAGVRGVRFNLRRGGSESLERLESFGRRLHDLVGWHVELYADARDLAALDPLVRRLPAVSVDHLGLSTAGLPTLLRLAETGVRVKATGFGRVDFPVGDALRAIHRANPSALMFGTDLPSTRAPRPFRDTDIEVVVEALGEAEAAKVFWGNARRFYRCDVGQFA
jgi:predicted TIM-barrel fold metal-dependent hydrolase